MSYDILHRLCITGSLTIVLGLGGGMEPGLAQTLEDPGSAANAGFLYGTVSTKSGREYTGILRWDDEEAAWDDLFNSGKEEDRYSRYVPKEERRRGKAIKVFGFTIGYSWDEGEVSRLFVARFGDIRRIKVVGRDAAEVTMKSGETYYVEGSANDVEADVRVLDPSLGEVEVSWRNIKEITFAPTPRDARPPAARLYGTALTSAGSFQGFLQWDKQENLSIDELDGETDDGDLSIPMGNLRSIEKRNRRGSWVELKDGRRLVLEDTNDVDDSMRGLFVEDPRYGRVEVSWTAFERIDFEEVGNSGLGYDDYPPGRPLRGTVTSRGGEQHRGRIVYDLDESETWELLNGESFDVEFYIPFSRVRSVEPRGSDSSQVTLIDGIKLHLEDAADVSEDNAGVLVFPEGGGTPVYLGWPQVERIDFE